jgi:hypothetical protein
MMKKTTKSKLTSTKLNEIKDVSIKNGRSASVSAFHMSSRTSVVSGISNKNNINNLKKNLQK